MNVLSKILLVIFKSLALTTLNVDFVAIDITKPIIKFGGGSSYKGSDDFEPCEMGWAA